MRTGWPLLAAGLYSVLSQVVLVRGCMDSCKECSGPQNDLCLECRTGWTLHDNTCVDIDECGTELGQCPPNTYCFNTEGNYQCKGCDQACVGCMGAGPARCRKCAAGYRLTGAKCLGKWPILCMRMCKVCIRMSVCVFVCLSVWMFVSLSDSYIYSLSL
ncbi:unnamed protein product, partial [Oncorhynchus mykiss]